MRSHRKRWRGLSGSVNSTHVLARSSGASGTAHTLTAVVAVRGARYRSGMRLGVIDVGSNTVHFLVVDAYYGGHPLPAYSHKVELKLSENLLPDGTIGA